MILYFANRNMEIVGTASTSLTDRHLIISDSKKESIASGNAVLDVTIMYYPQDRLVFEAMTMPGNYIFRHADGNGNYRVTGTNDYYTIIEAEVDSKNQTIKLYAESAGLDLLNDLAFSYNPNVSMTASGYIREFLGGIASSSSVMYEIGVDELPDKKLLLSWDNTETIIERLNSVANAFDCELDFTFDIAGLTLEKSYVNIRKKDNREKDVILRMNHNVSNVVITRSIENMATAIYPTGDNITLSGMTYDDGDIYLNGGWLRSRTALENWYRISTSSSSPGHIYREYQYSTKDKNTLLQKSIEYLKKVSEPDTVYEVDIEELPEGIIVGDRISIVDKAGEVYVSARILNLTTSITTNTRTAVLGDYKQKSSGISDKVLELSQEFNKQINNLNVKIDNLSLDNITYEDLDRICV